MVGTSGRLATGLVLDTAMARSFPAFTCCCTAGTPVMISSTWPPSTSLTAGAVPLYGMCWRSVCVRSLKYSIAMCAALPLPPDA